jgi:hypothetical protein
MTTLSRILAERNADRGGQYLLIRWQVRLRFQMRDTRLTILGTTLIDSAQTHAWQLGTERQVAAPGSQCADRAHATAD